MKLSHIRDILAVAECGSLRAAGRHLNIAQPAITRSIREIERELGVSLFERHAKGVRPTQMGQAFLRRAKAIEAELRRVQDEIEQLKGHSSGQVAVALSSASSIALLPSAIAAFRKRFPDALLKISEGLFQAVEAEILDGQLDFYVGPIDPTISNTRLMVEKLFDNRRIVAAREGHPLADAKSLTELEGAAWIRPTLSARSSEADFNAMFAEFGVKPPRIAMHVNSALMTLITVASSDLLTIVPQQWLEFPATGERIVGLDLKEKLESAPLCIVRRHDMPLTPMAEHFCDLMRRASGHYVTRRNKA
ncbi:MAG: LysR substrate-binding domain-containing protein [Hyphomonadaceae bacterium]